MPGEPSTEDTGTTGGQAGPVPDNDHHPLAADIKGLIFDVFGTVVSWRTSIEAALDRSLRARVSSPEFALLPASVQSRARELLLPSSSSEEQPLLSTPRFHEKRTNWPAEFAAEWHTTYTVFTRTFVPGVTPWKDVDGHYLDSLVTLLDQWGLSGVYRTSSSDSDSDEETLLGLSRAWRRLSPWPDSSPGIHALQSSPHKLSAATLSNGNKSLLSSLNTFGHLGFLPEHLFSAEDFRAYKPHPSTYLGAVKKLGLEPNQVAMVAAHLGDLQHARSCGLRTVYVERVAEEEWRVEEDRYGEARGWVDLWIPLDAGGFEELARRLGKEGEKKSSV